MPNIADQTEKEVIETILRMYTKDERAVHNISDHLSKILTRRRSIIRERRKHPCDQQPSVGTDAAD